MLRTRIRLFIYFAGSALLPSWLPMIFSENGLSTFKLMKLIKHWFIFRWEAVRGGHQGGRGPGGCRGCHPPTPRPTQARLPLPGPLPPALCTVRTTRATREREREKTLLKFWSTFWPTSRGFFTSGQSFWGFLTTANSSRKFFTKFLKLDPDPHWESSRIRKNESGSTAMEIVIPGYSIMWTRIQVNIKLHLDPKKKNKKNCLQDFRQMFCQIWEIKEWQQKCFIFLKSLLLLL